MFANPALTHLSDIYTSSKEKVLINLKGHMDIFSTLLFRSVQTHN